MKFCTICGLVMETQYSTSGNMIFVCVCTNKIDANPEDTMIRGGVFDNSLGKNSTNLEIYEKYIRNSAKDPIGCKIMEPCPSCNLPFITITLITSAQTSICVCSCGYLAVLEQYKMDTEGKI